MLWKPLRRNEIRESHRRSSVVSCRCLRSKDVAKNVCDGGALSLRLGCVAVSRRGSERDPEVLLRLGRVCG
jgi:hypothetical protein